MKKSITFFLLSLFFCAVSVYAQNDGLAGYVEGHGGQQASAVFQAILIIANLVGVFCLFGGFLCLWLINKPSPPQRLQEAGTKAVWIPFIVAGGLFSLNFFIDLSRGTVSGQEEDSDTWNKLRGSYHYEMIKPGADNVREIG